MSICKRVSAAVICIIFLFLPKASQAFIDPTGPVQVAYLAKILIENIKHYYQLQQMIQRAQSHEDFLRLVNSGIENSIGLLNALPVKDEKILADIRDFKKAFDAVNEIYGKVPKSKEQALQLLNDQTVAESMRMANSFKSYSEEQERNSLIIASQSREASPKGAVRMQAETSAHILRSLSQLIRLNTQMLKLQSEQLALNNKSGKDQVMGFQRAEQSLGDGFKNFKMDTSLARF
ncbi:MAG: hypothetical protein K2X47_01370 [Bdellovibrionales bacterium]|nr:hypothetical protein [Bdellovibrionales bacterium]